VKKTALLTSLTLAVLMLTAACGGAVTTAPQQPVQTQAIEMLVTEQPVQVTGEVYPPPVSSDEYRPPEKPLPPMTLKPPLAFFERVEGIGEQSIGFTFPGDYPGWPIAIKAAPFKDIAAYPYGLDPSGLYTPVGLVEIGPGSDRGAQPGAYLVLIDLSPTSFPIFGEIRQLYGSTVYSIEFQRIPQVRNPFRLPGAPIPEFVDPDNPPDNSAVITADGVCFVIKSVDPSSRQEIYTRYCSVPNTVLSVRANYEENYKGLEESILKTAELFEMQDILIYEQIISEMEDPNHIMACSAESTALQERLLSGEELPEEEVQKVLQHACGSDITVAPVKEEHLQEMYKGKVGIGPTNSGSSRLFIAAAPAALFQPDNPNDGIFPLAVGVMQVHNPINTDYGIVQPGEYRLDYWFYNTGEFYSASITGYLFEDNSLVADQPVPSIPAGFVNEDGSEQPAAQISACRIFGRCTFFQRNCP